MRHEQYAAAAFRVALFGFGTFAQTRGFSSFNDFKEVFGRAGDNRAWHHIVEQNPPNLARFGPQILHNPQNLAIVEDGAGSVHGKISGFYSSKQEALTGSSSLTVRQWISQKSFDEQYIFGLQTLERFGGGQQMNLFGLANSWIWPSALSPFPDGDANGDD